MTTFAGVHLSRRGRRASARWWERFRPRRPVNPVRTAASVAVVLVLAAVVLTGALWKSGGGGWAIIETPSMGRAIPVGTVIFTTEQPLRTIQVGDVVTYHPSSTPHETFTHRVVRKNQDGSLQVQGDNNGAADPLPVHQADLVGRVVGQWYAVGWLIRALPFLIVGVLVILVATTLVPVRWRSAVRITTVCLLASVSALILRPFVRPVLINVSTDGPDGAVAHVVSTGLMPTRVTGAPSAFVDLVNGQLGSVPVQATQNGDPFRVSGSPHLDLTWILLVIAVCALPMLWCLVVGLSPDEEELDEAEEEA